MNLQPLLDEFPTYLEENRLASPRHIPFLMRWVERYLAGTYEVALPGDRLLVFLERLQRNTAIADWQVRQAEEAVRLFRLFVGQCQAISPGAPKPSANSGMADQGAMKPVMVPPVSISTEWASAMADARKLMRLRNYSRRTEQAYLEWAERFVKYCGMRPPAELDDGDVKRFLTHLATERRVSASTQNQAFNALLFLFRNVLGQSLGGLQDTVRARRGPKLPVVLSQDEVWRLLAEMDGTPHLMAQLIYGAGLRLMECVTLRVKDIDFGQGRVFVRSGKGDKDRSTLLPQSLVGPLQEHLVRVREQHGKDLAAGHGEANLPGALSRKYPNAGKEWAWQYVFPSSIISPDREDGILRRFHTTESNLQRAVKEALRQSGIAKHAGVHTLRHSFATHLLEGGVNIREIQELLGAQPRGDDDDLHACAAGAGAACGKSAGSPSTSRGDLIRPGQSSLSKSAGIQVDEGGRRERITIPSGHSFLSSFADPRPVGLASGTADRQYPPAHCSEPSSFEGDAN